MLVVAYLQNAVQSVDPYTYVTMIRPLIDSSFHKVAGYVYGVKETKGHVRID
jgi:hypothetical protein